MDVPKTLVYSLIVYAIALLYGMNFVASGISLGIFSADFWLLTLIIILPAVFLALRAFRYSISFLEGREKLLRHLFVASAAVSVLVVLFLIVPLSY